MVNIILVSHFSPNQQLYSQIFTRIPFVRFILIEYNQTDVFLQLHLIQTKMKEMNMVNDDVDFIMLSSNYGSPASSEVNIPMFEYFLHEFKYAQLIAIGNTSASLLKALELNERIFIMGTSVLDIDSELVSNLYSSIELKPRICSIKSFKELLEYAEQTKNTGKRLKNINQVKLQLSKIKQDGIPTVNLPVNEIQKMELKALESAQTKLDLLAITKSEDKSIVTDCRAKMLSDDEKAKMSP